MFDQLFSTLMAACGNMSMGMGGFDNLNMMNAAFNASMNSQMQGMTDKLVQRNMNDPHIQQMYQQYLQQGGTLSFPQYCFRYAETGGFTPQGTAAAINTQRAIQQQDQAHLQAYHQHSANLQAQTTAYRNAVDDRIAQGRGENLLGQGQYVNQYDGTTWQLPATAAPGSSHYDPASGNEFRMDIHGQYWMSNGQDWWYPMNRQ